MKRQELGLARLLATLRPLQPRSVLLLALRRDLRVLGQPQRQISIRATRHMPTILSPVLAKRPRSLRITMSRQHPNSSSSPNSNSNSQLRYSHPAAQDLLLRHLCPKDGLRTWTPALGTITTSICRRNRRNGNSPRALHP